MQSLWKLKECFYWPGHYSEVQKWCSTCAVHARRKNPTPKPKAKLCPVPVSAPLELVAMDILGPLPESAIGNSFVLVIGDYFTKWLEVYPIPNQEAITVAKKIVNEFICRFSVPRQLHSNQGAQFESLVVAEVCKLLHIDKARTTPYHPQSDGLIERFNRTLLQMLATCTDTHPFDWEDYIKRVCMAYNVIKHSSTHHSPFFLMFERQAQLPNGVMCGTPEQGTHSIPQYVSKLSKVLGKLLQRPVDTLLFIRSDKRKFTTNKSMAIISALGIWFGCLTCCTTRNLQEVLQALTGPYQVVDEVSDNNYRIKNTQRSFKVKVVYFD